MHTLSACIRLSLWIGLPLMAWLPGGRSQALVNITWAAAQTITGDSDVSTAGTLVQATNLGNFEGWEGQLGHTDFSVVVNGVTFAAHHVTPSSGVQSMSVGSFTLSEDPHFLTSGGSSIPNQYFAAPTSSLSQSYKSLLVGYATTYAPSGGGDRTMTLTMPNLTIGRNYQFQWWTAVPELAADFRTEATGGIELSSNTQGAAGGLGQFARGTFTATQATMSIQFWGNGNSPGINAFQLRDITAVPEPSTYALIFGLCALGWRCVCRRRRSPGL